MQSPKEDKQKHWYVMRDLKRPNALHPAYKLFQEEHIEVFTPMKWHLKIKNGKRVREEVPFIKDLLFVHDTLDVIDSIVGKVRTIQYRYQKGGYKKQMIVSDMDMERFIHAVSVSENPKYYLPSELTPAMCNRTVVIVGGELDGYEGKLLTMRGSVKRRILIELPGFFSVGVEVSPEYVKVL